MGTRAWRLLVGFAVCGAFAAPAMAQEGHPLTGTWLGEWGPKKTPVFVVLGWNGLDITGAINPGPNAAPIKNATLTGPVGGGRGGGGGGGRGAVTPAAASVVPVSLVIPQAPAAGGAGGRGGGGQRGGGGAAQTPPPAAAAGSTDWLVHLEADGNSAAASVRPTLRQGDSGELVREVQQRVGANVDGVFGPQTEAAVRKYQTSHGVTSDGIVAPSTWKLWETAAAAIHYVIDGKVENIGLANRAIVGTWSENGQKGDLRMVRQ